MVLCKISISPCEISLVPACSCSGYGLEFRLTGVVIPDCQDIERLGRPSRQMVMEKNVGFIRFGLYCLLCWTLIFPVAGCGLFDHETDDVIIEIGSSRLTGDDLKREIKFTIGGMTLPSSQAEEIKALLVRQIVDYYLVIEYGRENGIAVSEAEFEAELKALRGDYAESELCSGPMWRRNHGNPV